MYRPTVTLCYLFDFKFSKIKHSPSLNSLQDIHRLSHKRVVFKMYAFTVNTFLKSALSSLSCYSGRCGSSRDFILTPSAWMQHHTNQTSKTIHDFKHFKSIDNLLWFKML